MIVSLRWVADRSTILDEGWRHSCKYEDFVGSGCSGCSCCRQWQLDETRLQEALGVASDIDRVLWNSEEIEGLRG